MGGWEGMRRNEFLRVVDMKAEAVRKTGCRSKDRADWLAGFRWNPGSDHQPLALIASGNDIYLHSTRSKTFSVQLSHTQAPT